MPAAIPHLPRLPDRLFDAYEWVDAGGELDILATLYGAALDKYATEAADNAVEHDEHRVTRNDIMALAEWLREVGHFAPHAGVGE